MAGLGGLSRTTKESFRAFVERVLANLRSYDQEQNAQIMLDTNIVAVLGPAVVFGDCE